jgi:diadenosine tetraphosphate (Ap4A) HIT family hydrolase
MEENLQKKCLGLIYNFSMEDLSEQAIIKNCPHCDVTSQAFTHIIEESSNFYIVCDAHPLTEGHILIIPKGHFSCIGEYPENIFNDFLMLNKKVSKFLLDIYGSVGSFEHGIFGQTVFHSHIHYLPFSGKPIDIIPENKFFTIENLSKLKNLFKKDGGYLFFSLGNSLFSVDVKLAKPRFFRDRFALAVGKPEKSNWKEFHANESLMKEGAKDNMETQRKWKEFF